VVPPRNPEALAGACLILLRDAELRKRLGTAARGRALQFFTVDQAIETFDDLYVRVAAGLVPGCPDGDSR
jgi:glycosyltransferase involved in cell wall biosynthesis